MTTPLLTVRALFILRDEFYSTDTCSRTKRDWDIYTKRVNKLKARLSREVSYLTGGIYK